ncbi:MAG TPA: ferritin-like domain-containing protein [Bacillales bacterium]|nr:ferritin-like domain-containing protein [Bacillales bacterium]
MYSNQNYYYVPQHYDYYRLPSNNQLVNDIQKASNAEYSAIICYEKLAKMAPTKEERNRILEIQQDEKRHLNEFRSIYANLTGTNPTYKIIEKCPEKYREGIEFALKDEQESVDFYLEIADKSQNPYIKERFRRAAADEQNHAVWFLYFFHKSKR